MSTESKIIELLRSGRTFQRGGGDNSYGISYGFRITLRLHKDKEYNYTFFEEENGRIINDEKLTLQEEKIVSFLCSKHQLTEEEILNHIY